MIVLKPFDSCCMHTFYVHGSLGSCFVGTAFHLTQKNSVSFDMT